MKASIFNRYALILMVAPLLFLTGCDIHEYPTVSPTAEHEVTVEFNVKSMFDWENMTEWEYDGSTKSYVPEGRMRFIFRLYPVDQKSRAAVEHVQEHIVYGDIEQMYGATFTLDLLPGEYDLMAWADLEIPDCEGEFYHDASDFSAITLTRHEGNSHHRDAFRGSKRITVYSDMYEREKEPITIYMERPFAKFEIVTNDLEEFITKQMTAAAAKEAELKGETKDGTETKSIDLNEYVVKIIYPMYMPNTYNMFTDKPIDSTTGISFESDITQVSATEATLGFDHVFVNGIESLVSVQIAIYDKEGTLLSQTGIMDIPLTRNRHTIVTGSFLIQEASGGVSIDPSFDGEYNIWI